MASYHKTKDEGTLGNVLDNRGKGQVMMASYHETKDEGTVGKVLEVEPSLILLARRVQNIYKFQNFSDQMDFHPNQHIAITKATIELNDFSKGQILLKGH